MSTCGDRRTVLPMIRLTFCLRRLPSLTREEFQRYWLETHGPLVRKHAKALNLRRYVQLHTLGVSSNHAIRASRGGPEASPLFFGEETTLVGG